MSRVDVVAEHEAMQPQDGPRRLDVSDRPFQFEVLPLRCDIAKVCAVLTISRRQFDRLMATKALALVELEAFGRRRVFSGESLARVAKQRRTR